MIQTLCQNLLVTLLCWPHYFAGHITLTDDWARGILQSVDWFKCEETNGKIQPRHSF